MRQLVSMLDILNDSSLVEYYNQILSYHLAFTVKKLPSLDEFLALTSDKAKSAPTSFDEKTDKLLEEHALKTLEERRKKNGK